MKYSIQSLVSLIILGISLPLLLWGFWPPRMETREVAIQFPAGGLSLSGERLLQLKVPTYIRSEDSAVAELRLVTEEGAVTDASVFEQYTVIAEARMELPFADVRPADLVSTTLAPQGMTTFFWEILPREEGELQGDVWVYVRFVPKGGGEETQIPVSVQQVHIRCGSMWKRSGSEARALGVGGTLVGLALGFWAWRRRS